MAGISRLRPTGRAPNEMSHDFAYTGPALSVVPINFRGLFEVQHGQKNFNRSGVGVTLSSPLEPSGAEITCLSLAFIDPELCIDAAFLAADPDAGLRA